MNHRAPNPLTALNTFKERIIFWVDLLKNCCNLIVQNAKNAHYSLSVKVENDDSEENKLLELERKLEVAKTMVSSTLESTNLLIKSFTAFEYLNKQNIDDLINDKKSSYGEIVVQVFENLPESKKLACFISFMEIIENFKKE